MGDGTQAAAVAARLLATIARRVGASLALDETLDAVAEAVVEALGFRAAVVNLLAGDGALHVVAVAGSQEIRTALLGTHSPSEAWDAMLGAATAWGGLRFLDHRTRRPEGTEDMQFFVPVLPVPAGGQDQAWHPEDALFAPLLGSDGSLLGVLSVDDPVDGLRPDAVQQALLEAFAVQAALAIEHAREHQALVDSETLLQRIFDESPVGKALFGPDGRFQRVNRAFCAFLGREPDEFVGRRIMDFAHPEERESTERLSREIRGQARVVEMERRYLHADGSERWGRLRLTRIGADDRTSVLAAIEDITEARAAEAKLRHLAMHDSLTGLPNRTLILDRLDQALARVRRDGGSVAVAVVDIDHFKLVNDSYGHPAGDQLLVDVAHRLSSVLRASDTAGRLGGDEFVVVCEGVDDVGEVEAVAERLRTAVRVPVVAAGAPLVSSASIGATIGTGAATADQLVAEADAALYRAKSGGRGRYELFDEAMRRSSAAHLETLGELEAALLRDEFELHYQPILDEQHGVVVGFEALLRWQHPTRGLLLPGEFLGVLSDSDLDAPVTRWVLRQACREVAALGRGEGWEPVVSVNLSPRQLSRRDLACDVRAALTAAALPPERLWLEITEEHLVDGAHRSVVESLRALGCRIVLDDFGTGYSGLTYLQQLPVDVLKIDRQFIARVASDRVSAGITAAVTDLAQLLDIAVVAEGVETAEQAAIVAQMGIDYVQGFYFGRPAPLRTPLTVLASA